MGDQNRIRRDSYRTPGGSPSESGAGYGIEEKETKEEQGARVTKSDQRRWNRAQKWTRGDTAAERREHALAWASKHLPSEHPPFVYAAYEGIRLAGHRPTRDAVAERLRDQGRDMASLENLA